MAITMDGIFVNGQKVTFHPENILSGDASAYTEEIGTAVEEWLEENVTGGEQVTDTTLTLPGVPADAKKTGDEIGALKEDLNNAVFIVPFSHWRLDDTSRWTFGSYLIEENGRVQNNRADACITDYIEFAEPLKIYINNVDYAFVIWTYSAYSQSATVYSPSNNYSIRQELIIPKNGANRFRIGIIRVDGATLTTDFTDPASDAYKIKESLTITKTTSSDLSLSNVPINSDALKDIDIGITKDVINRYDKTTITENSVFQSDLAIHSRDGWAVSDFIDISDLEQVSMVGTSNVVWYDSEKTALSYTNTALSRTNETSFEKPEGAVYLRASIQNTWYNLAQIGKETFKGNYVDHDDFAIPGLKIYHYQIITNDFVRVRELEYVIPETYGAVGDGVTDDTAAFVSALKNGKPVKLGNKIYKANIEIIRNNVTIIGNGNGSVIIPADTAKPVIKINTDTAETTSDLISFVTIKDIKIFGESAVVGLSVRCAQSCIFERLRIESCYAGGIVMNGVFDSRFTDCEIIKCGNTSINTDDRLNNYSILVDGITGMNTNAIVFEGCRVEHSPRMLSLQNTQQLMFSNCKFESHVKQYSSDGNYAPIRIMNDVFGANFVNCLMTYSGLLSDSEQQSNYNSGNPFVYVNSDGIQSNQKTNVLFSGCQFRTQPNFAVRYFIANYTMFDRCTFDRCTGLSNGNMLRDYGEMHGCDFVIASDSRALLLDGNNIIVDGVRIHAVSENTARQVVYLSASLARGYVKVLYTGDDRDNLAGGTISVPVEFIGLRTYST